MEPARRCSGVLGRETKPGSQEVGAGAWEMSGGPEEAEGRAESSGETDEGAEGERGGLGGPKIGEGLG